MVLDCVTYHVFLCALVDFKITSSFPACDKTLLDEKLKKKTCLEWYELQDGDPRLKNGIMLKPRVQKKEKDLVKNSKLCLNTV